MTSAVRAPFVAAAITLAVPAFGILAQSSAPADSIHASRTLFTWRDGALAAGFAGLTVAMFPVDRSIAQRLQDSSNQANHFLKDASRRIQYLADPGAVVIGVSLYGVGRAAKWRDVADLGLHGTEAVVLSGVVTGAIKMLAGRARPNFAADTNPRDFHLGRGFLTRGAFQSFPSGHTTAAFAAASAVTSESRRWWPRGTWLVGPVMYGGATLVGLSRMYNNAHWASDVVAGAAIGTFAGLKVVRYSHGHSDNPVDRWLLPRNVSAPATRRIALSWSFDF